MDCRTALGLGFDCKRSVHKFQSFLHADKAEARWVLSDRFAIKACAGITNREVNFFFVSPQSDMVPSYATMFG